MKSEALFEGFRVAAGEARFGDQIRLRGEPVDCKVSGRDTGGVMCVFECEGAAGGPRHRHREQDEWIYVLDGEIELELGKKRLRLGAGESAFVPRKASHAWAAAGAGAARILNVYEPAGTMEAFFREVGAFTEPPIHEALGIEGLHRVFAAHGMDLVGPPLRWKTEGKS